MRLPGTYSRRAVAGARGRLKSIAPVRQNGISAHPTTAPVSRPYPGRNPSAASTLKVLASSCPSAWLRDRRLVPLRRFTRRSQRRNSDSSSGSSVPWLSRRRLRRRIWSSAQRRRRRRRATTSSRLSGKRLDMGAERRGVRHGGVGLRPTLPKHPRYDGGQVLGVAQHEVAERAEIERRGSHLFPVEEVRRHPWRQAEAERLPDLVPLRLRAPGIAPVSVEARDDRRVDVLGDHRFVPQVEGGRIDPAREQLERLREIGSVVRDGTAVGEVHRHAMPAPRAPGPLPVVGGERRHVPHQHRVELADVDAELQGRRAHQAVHRIGRALEEILEALALSLRDHGGVLLGAQHRVGPVEEVEVVVVVVLPLPLENAVAAPREAAVVRQVPDRRSPAASATPDSPVRTEPQPVAVHLVDALHVRQWPTLRPLEAHRYQQPPIDQPFEEALQERLRLLRRHAPPPRDLAHGGVAGRAQPLGDLGRLLRRFPAELGAVRGEEARQVALLDLPVALHPVLREDLVLGIVEDALSPQVVEHAGNPLAEPFRGDAEPVRVVLNPGQGGIEALVLDLHPAPGLEAERLPGRERHLAQHLEAKVLAALLGVTPAGALAAGDLPDLGEQRPGERLVRFQPIVEPRHEVAHRAWTWPDAFRHQRPQPEAAGVVLHPARLERGVLAVVAEDEQAPPLRVVHHVLGKDVHVRDVDRAHRPRRLAVVGAGSVPGGATREAARQHAGPLARSALPDRVQEDGSARRSARKAPRHGAGVCRPAMAAEVERRGSGMARRVVLIVVVARADQPVEQHDTAAAARLLEGLPPASLRADPAPARAPAGELEVLEERDVVVLPAGGAGRYRKVRAAVAGTGIPGRVLILRREPQAGAVRILRKRHHRPADPAHESVHDRPQQRPPVAARGGAQRQPGEDLGFRHRPPCAGLDHVPQLVEGAR